jgi:uncharacterized delta-60 repeat protein
MKRIATRDAHLHCPHPCRSATEAGLIPAHSHPLLLAALSLIFLAAPLPAQTPDSFNPVVGGAVNSITVQTDGKIVLGGNFTYINFHSQQGITRLSADGTLDTNMPGNPDGGVSTTAVQEDGKIAFATVYRVYRFNGNGSNDDTFQSPSPSSTLALGLQADSKLLVGGYFYNLGSLGRLNTDGTLDTNFNFTVFGTVQAIAVQSDGKVVVGGNLLAMDGGLYRTNLARLNPDGSLDSSFTANADADVYALALQPNGSILVGGSFTNLSGQPRYAIGRVNTNGVLDASFAPVLDNRVLSFALQADGGILLGGYFNLVAGQPQYYLARLDSSGAVDTSFTPNPNGTVTSLALQPDGKLLLGGTFNAIGAQYPHTSIARLTNAPATETISRDASSITWMRGGTAPEVSRVTFDVFTNAGVYARFNGARIPGGWQATGLNLPPNATIRARGALAASSVGYVETGAGLPLILTQPPGLTNNAGTFTLLTASVIGQAPLSYQWFKNGAAISDGGNVSGATAPTLLLTNVLGPDTANYQLVVSNSFGSVTSIVANLTVLDPIVNGQPASLAYHAGQTANFTVGAFGSAPLSFQWFKGGAALQNGGTISGAQSNTLSLSNIVGGDAGQFFAVVTNTWGSVTSQVASLAVIDPYITRNPSSATAQAGQATSITVSAAGTALVYQWRKNGSPVPGASAAVLSFTNAQPADAGNYDVIVSSSFGSATSSVAVLTINLATFDYFNAPIISSVGQVNALAVQPDGKILAGGSIRAVLGSGASQVVCTNLIRLSANGVLDTNFNPKVNNTVFAIAVQTDGKLVVAGSFSSLGGQLRSRIGRLYGDGTLDASFNPQANADVRALAIQPDGKILLGGSFSTVSSQSRLRLARLNSDGTLDSAFTPSSDGQVLTIQLQPDGKILIAGLFTNLSGQVRLNIGRLNSDGSVDAAFHPNASGSLAAVYSFALQADQKIIVGGHFGNIGGLARTNLARLNPDGTADTNFTARAGTVAEGEVDTLAMQADGRIVVAGGYAQLGDQLRYGLGRLNSNGTVDPYFIPSTNPNYVSPYVLALAIQADGKTLLGGQFNLPTGPARTNLARLNSTDAVTESLAFDNSSVTWLRAGPGSELWRATFDFTTNGVDWASLGDASRISAGWQWSGGSIPSGSVIRARGFVVSGNWFLETLGGTSILVSQPASRTNNAGTIATFSVGAVGGAASYQWFRNSTAMNDGLNILNGEAIYGSASSTLTLSNVLGDFAGGYFVVVSNSFGSVTSAVANLTVIDPWITTQPSAQTWNSGQTATFHVSAAGVSPLRYQWRKANVPRPQATNSSLTISNVQPPDGGSYDVVVTNLFGRITSAVAVLTVNLALPDAFDPNGSGGPLPIAFAIQTDGKIVTAGDISFPSPCCGLRRLNADGTSDTNFAAAIASVYSGSLGIQPDGQILVGNGYTDGAQPLLWRLNGDGSLDTNFALVTTSSGFGGSLALQPDGKILFSGLFNSVSGQLHTNLVRLNPDGSVDNAFNPSSDYRIFCQALQTNGAIVVGGQFALLNGQPQTNIGRLNPDGTLDTNFNASADAELECLAIQPDGKILVGGLFTNLSGLSRPYFGRLNPDGTLDNSFDPQANGTVRSVALQADGKIVAAGDFTSLGGRPRNFLARLSPDGSADPFFNPAPNAYVYSIAMQSDGALLVSGKFNVIAQAFRNGFARITNPDAASQNLSYDGTAIRWSRGGANPEVWRTMFESSDDNIHWNNLGPGQRTPGGWQFPNPTLTANSVIRARGFTCGGHGDASAWFMQSTQAVRLTPPTILATDGAFGPHSNRFTFNTRALFGQVVVIEASTNLSVWLPIQTNLVTAAGLFFFADADWVRFPHRFYRAQLYQEVLPPPRILSGNAGFASNNFGFDLAGIIGQTVVVDASTNFQNWLPISTNQFTGAPLYFSDLSSSNYLYRFYRARIQ